MPATSQVEVVASGGPAVAEVRGIDLAHPLDDAIGRDSHLTATTAFSHCTTR